MDQQDTLKKLVVLRNIAEELLQGLDAEIKKISPAPAQVQKRKSRKRELQIKYESYFATGKWNEQKEITPKTFSK